MAKSTSKLFQSEEPKEMKEDAMNLPEIEGSNEIVDSTAEIVESTKEEVKSPESAVDDIQDIDLAVIKKRRFRINGDNNKIIELNVSDLNITNRLSTAYKRLLDYMESVGDILADLPEGEELSEEYQEKTEQALKQIDDNMKKEIDFIFASPVSDICSDGGSMYDPFEGSFRYEHIIDALLKLYERNLEKEFSKMKRRVSDRTSKYTKKYHN